MALTPSQMIPLGTLAPNFELVDAVSGKVFTYHDIKQPIATVVMFICNHCPYVKHIQTKLSLLAKSYLKKSIGFVAINSNDVVSYPDDSPENMAIFAKANDFSFPYLFDESQEIAKAYGAACTPDFYIFDGADKLVYRGQFDGSRPGNHAPITGEDLQQALDHLLSNTPIPTEQQPSIGCNIKWKTGSN